jgi:hypothetical protein
MSLPQLARVTNDRDILKAVLFFCPVVGYVTTFLLPHSQVPLLVVVFLGCNMLSRTKYFQSLVRAIEPKLSSLADLASAVLPRMGIPSDDGSASRFDELSSTSQFELLSAVKSIQQYSINSKKLNDRRRRLFKLMSWRQQKLCDDAGYSRRLNKIDVAINRNQDFLNRVSTFALETYKLEHHHFDNLRQGTSNSSSLNYRVIESLGHFVRDWCEEGSAELDFLISKVVSDLNRVIPLQQRSRTCIVVPGSGLGRIAHEVAVLGLGPDERFGAVHAVEYSGLMHLCNSYVYAADGQEPNISAHIHGSSNIVATLSQFRTSRVKWPQSRPNNLELHHEDFRYFKVPNADLFDNVVVVSVFFMDTAENIVEYMDAIQGLTSPSRRNSIKRGYWINLGPLKYGSASQAELTAEELAQVRRAMGWIDVDYANTIEHPHEYANNGLVGYITDRQSMWQGFYGLSTWTAGRKENRK